MSKNKEFGMIGESIAMKHLINKGYCILFNNFLMKFGEIDIIARENDGTLCFIEVKTIAIQEYGLLSPEDNLTPQKLNTVNRMANWFAGVHPELIDEERGWRVDLIAITLSGRKGKLRHYKNI